MSTSSSRFLGLSHQDDRVSVSRRGHADLALGLEAPVVNERLAQRSKGGGQGGRRRVRLRVLLEGRLGVHESRVQVDCAARSFADFVTPGSRDGDSEQDGQDQQHDHELDEGETSISTRFESGAFFLQRAVVEATACVDRMEVDELDDSPSRRW